MTDKVSFPPARSSASLTSVIVRPLAPFKRLIASLGGALVVLILGILVYASISSERESRAEVERSHLTIDRTRSVLSDLKDAETGQRGFLLTGDAKYLAPYNAALRTITADTAAVRALTRGNAFVQRELAALGPQVHAKLAGIDSTITLRKVGDSAGAIAFVETDQGKISMDSIRAVVAAVETSERQALAAHGAEEEHRTFVVTVVLIGGTVAAFFLAMLLNGVLTRYAESQTEAAMALDLQNRVLDQQNAQLESQALELELQNQQLQDQAAELELQQQHLQEQAIELEAQNELLQQQATELETQTEDLHAVTEELQERTEEAERQRALAESDRAAADSANRAKSDFLATMSHELRTPLNAIGGYVDLMELGIRGPVTVEQRNDLARIKRSGRHLLGLINDILNFAKLEAGKVEFRPSDVRIVELVAGVEALVAPQMRAKGIRVSYARCDPAVMARADAEKVQQIILNLLTNSLKFTASGGEIRISCAMHENRAIISVGDTGCGISAGNLHTVFDPFVQIDRQLASDSAASVQSGVGLGLAISRELARGMGGDIHAESRVGVGSVFTLVLPAASASSLASSAHSAKPVDDESGEQYVDEDSSISNDSAWRAVFDSSPDGPESGRD